MYFLSYPSILRRVFAMPIYVNAFYPHVITRSKLVLWHLCAYWL